MAKKTVIIIVSVIVGLIVAAGLGVLIWWLVDGRHTSGNTETEVLNTDGFGNIQSTAALTTIPNVGGLFWWFYPTTATEPTTRPIVLFLDGIAGVPPSLLANFGMFGPFDFNMNQREDSWVNEFNLLFVDAPLGTGFSRPVNDESIPTSLEENVDHLVAVLDAFYELHEEYKGTPLYIFGQAHGAQLALGLAVHLDELNSVNGNQYNVSAVGIGNGYVAPSITLSQLGFYLEELAYADGYGRAVLENFSNNVTTLVNEGNYEEAFALYRTLGIVIVSDAEVAGINLAHVVDRVSSRVEDFMQRSFVQGAFGINIYRFMQETIAPRLGVAHIQFDASRLATIEASKSFFMIPSINKVEYLLQNTSVNVVIYNGNLDVISNTPGQLEWVNRLQWSGQQAFLSSPRNTFSLSQTVQGYFRETERLQFYWVNAAGTSVPLESPGMMRRIMQRIVAQ